MSLSTDERKDVAEAFITATDHRVPVIVQVGHNSLDEARTLAKHAAAAGADIVSATCPSYFKPTCVQTLVDCMADIASSVEEAPFYYYHIPVLTGSSIDIVEFLERGREKIPNLAGLKYTDTKLFEFQACQAVADGELDIVFGCDEMLLAALATGATAAIGSTYNAMAPLYQRLIEAFHRNDLQAARASQMQSIEFIRTLNQYPFHPAMKEVLRMRGIDVGRCRLPHRNLDAHEVQSLRSKLETIDFFHWNDSRESAVIGAARPPSDTFTT
jgi:N-acetylneuraminate lyase